jgi:hypothetical protein
LLRLIGWACGSPTESGCGPPTNSSVDSFTQNNNNSTTHTPEYFVQRDNYAAADTDTPLISTGYEPGYRKAKSYHIQRSAHYSTYNLNSWTSANIQHIHSTKTSRRTCSLWQMIDSTQQEEEEEDQFYSLGSARSNPSSIIQLSQTRNSLYKHKTFHNG